MELDLVPVILKDGIVVRINVHEWGILHPALIISVSNCTIKLAISNKPDKYKALESDIVENFLMRRLKKPVSFRLTTQYFEYLFEGFVTDIQKSHLAGNYLIAVVEIVRLEERINERDFPRYEVFIPGQSVSEWTNERSDIYIVNLSKNGLSAITQQKYYTGEICQIEFNVYNSILFLEGMVIRKQYRGKWNHYGLSFTTLKPDSKNLLDSLIEQLSMEDYYLAEAYFGDSAAKI